MIAVEFKDGEQYAEVCGLVQWDYGQYLKISGMPADDREIEVHFAAGRQKAPIAKTDITETGEIIARIPDELLQVGNELKAYIYLADADSGKTVRIINMPVKRRPKPEDYTDPEGQSLLRAIQAELKRKADNMMVDEEGYLQLLSGTTKIGDRVRLPAGGTGGREIELRNDGTAIQWRYTDSNEWTELIKLSELRGKDGQTPEFEIRDGHLFAIYQE